jgi:predicted MFS family arabinose efflux permease
MIVGATAIGFAIGNLGGGWLADAFGFNSMPWSLAGLSVGTLILGYLAMRR